MNKPENRGHFSGPQNAERVRLWRQEHPPQRRYRWHRIASQVARRLLTPRLTAALRNCGVQDMSDRQLALLLGVFSSLAHSGVQDVIARKIRQLMFLGYAVIRTSDALPRGS